jgi:hypothetical protein
MVLLTLRLICRHCDRDRRLRGVGSEENSKEDRKKRQAKIGKATIIYILWPVACRLYIQSRAQNVTNTEVCSSKAGKHLQLCCLPGDVVPCRPLGSGAYSSTVHTPGSLAPIFLSNYCKHRPALTGEASGPGEYNE